MRDPDLQQFLEFARAAFLKASPGGRSRQSVKAIFTRLEAEGEASRKDGVRLPVCRHLDAALSEALNDTDIAPLAEAFRAIEPRLTWYRRASWDETASPDFSNGHANTMVFGPGGLEEHGGLMLGASLLAPHVRYPDHDHAPEETYLVMSAGEFRHGESDWFSPGVGGSFYNTPAVRHAMRASEKPLFAFWALLSV